MMHIFTNSHDEAGLKWQNRHLMHCDTRQANFNAAIYGLNARCAFFGIVRICRHSAVHVIAFTKIYPRSVCHRFRQFEGWTISMRHTQTSTVSHHLNPAFTNNASTIGMKIQKDGASRLHVRKMGVAESKWK